MSTHRSGNSAPPGREWKRPVRVLVIFGTPFLYGQERAVIGLFDLLRPDVDPLFLLTRTVRRQQLPVFDVVRARGFRYTFLSDFWSWPRLQRPASMSELLQVIASLLVGNSDALRAALRADAIYVPNRMAFWHAVLACIFVRLRRGKVIYEFHEMPHRPSRTLQWLGPLVTRFVAGTATLAGSIARTQPFIPAEEIAVISRTVVPAAAPAAAAAARFAGATNIVFAGQVAPHKGVDTLVEAFALLAPLHPDVHLHIIGSCDDPDFRRRLDELAAPVAGCITWWDFRVDAASLIACGDIYVQPTRPRLHVEAASVAILEAAAAGVPAVVFRSGSLAEVVVHGETGLICSEDTAENLAADLTVLLDNANLRARMGAAARRRYECCYAPASVRAKWLDLLEGRA